MTLTALKLQLEVTKGVHAEDCAKEALYIANVLKVMVEFVHNDLRMVVSPNETLNAIMARYHQANEARRGQA
jgi:hypothetical protein